MRIGLDIDDTITDTFDVMFAYGQKFTMEDLKRDIKVKNVNDITNTAYVQAMLDWNNEDEKIFFDKYYGILLEEVRPYHLAIPIINKLKEEGHEIILITARFNTINVDVELATKKWCEKNGLKYDKLVIDAHNKGEIAEANNIDLFVDDSIRNCLSVDNKGIKTFIMNNKCNTECNHPNVTRVYSWPHLEKELRKEIK